MEGGLRFGNYSAAAFMRFKPFSSSLITNKELSETIKETIVQSLEFGSGVRDWRKVANAVYDAAGVPRLSLDDAENIFCTETSLAFGAVNYAKMQAVSDRFPYWEYSTAKDERVRTSHRILEGKIFKASDSEYFPPIGINCRCVAIPISQREAEKREIVSPDIVTPEIRANLQADKFIKDKVRLFRKWQSLCSESLK